MRRQKAKGKGQKSDDPRIEVHGPGYSKIVIGQDAVNDWEKYLDVMVTSIAENSGRSCINIATNHIQWDQPHEGNLFDHLYARRAFQRAMAS